MWWLQPSGLLSGLSCPRGRRPQIELYVVRGSTSKQPGLHPSPKNVRLAGSGYVYESTITLTKPPKISHGILHAFIFDEMALVFVSEAAM
jgi:hypothetical protein